MLARLRYAHCIIKTPLGCPHLAPDHKDRQSNLNLKPKNKSPPTQKQKGKKKERERRIVTSSQLPLAFFS